MVLLQKAVQCASELNCESDSLLYEDDSFEELRADFS